MNPAYLLNPGELRVQFEGWELIHDFEGKAGGVGPRRATAEIIARRPPRYIDGVWATPVAFGGYKINLALVRGRRERSERGGRSHIILKAANLLSISSLHVRNTEVKSRRFFESTREHK